MSLQTTATASVGAPPTGARARWILAVVASVAAPALFVAGQALLPVLPDDLAGAFAGMAAEREQMLASRVLTAAGAFLFVPALLAVFALVPAGARGSRLLLVGGVVMGTGSFLNGLSNVVQRLPGPSTTVLSCATSCHDHRHGLGRGPLHRR